MAAEARWKNLTSFYPPVMFVHMVKDVARAMKIRVDMALLIDHGVPVTEVLVHESPVLPDLFSQRIPYISNVTSAQMVAALNGSLTKQEKLLQNDARWFDWRKPLEDQELLPPQLQAHVEQELNVAFAFHEFSSLSASEIFQWFEYYIQARRFSNPVS